MAGGLPVEPVDVVRLVMEAGWKGWHVVTATAIAKAESNHDAYAVGVVKTEERNSPETGEMGELEPNPAWRSLDVGLFQINTHWHPQHKIADLLDPAYNTAAAYKLWQGTFDRTAGSWADRTHAAWSPWAVYDTGAFEQYLSMAAQAAREAGAIQ